MRGHRLAAAAGVLGLFAGIDALAPDPARREAWLSLVVLPLGYGHLIGGALRSRARPQPDLLLGLLRGVSLLTLFAAYTVGLRIPALWPWMLAPMLLVSAWHIVENDLALARMDRRALSLPPPRRRDVLPVAAATGVLAGLALVTPEGHQWALRIWGAAPPLSAPLTLGDLTAAILLYHALSFVVFGSGRARRCGGQRGAALRRALWVCHAAPLLLGALLHAAWPALHAVAAAPAVYLFWSVLHAVDTAWRRRPA